MNIFDDKILYKLIFFVLVIFMVAITSLAYFSGGMKYALFILWIIFALGLFWGIVIFSLLQKGIHASFNKIPKIIFWGGVNIFYLQCKLTILIIFFIVLSGYVWNFLNHHFPERPIHISPVSQMTEILHSR
jgi:hypothetical protein